MESFLKTFVFHSMNNGILYGPWIPVYGLGGLIILLISSFIFRNFKTSKLLNTIICVVVCMVFLTLLEFVGGILIEKIFHKVFWDYSPLKFNFGHYIALEISLIWGLITLIFIYFIGPLINLIIKKIPKWFSIFLVLIFLVDVVITILLV